MMKRRRDTLHLPAPRGLGMAWIGQKAAQRWDSHNNNTELQQNLSTARQMEIHGKDPLAIKMATGWERGADMEWRYEVPDFFYMQKVLNKAYSYGKPTPFSSLVKDERLLTMYPELNDYKVFIKLLPRGSRVLGYFDRVNKVLVASIINGDPDNELESVLIHETQHFIQEMEGFENGANTSAGLRDYFRTSGEVEARNAQHRRKMTAEERRKSLWSETTEPDYADPEVHRYPTKEATREQHKDDLAKARRATEERKQRMLRIALEILEILHRLNLA